MEKLNESNQVIDNLDLAHRIARGRINKGLPYGLDPDEVISAAEDALMASVGRYDANKGASFRTFAEKRIRGAMVDVLRRHSSNPRDAGNFKEKGGRGSKNSCWKRNIRGVVFSRGR